MFYTEPKFKDAITDYLKLLVEESYKSHTFKSFRHATFDIPNDFRMKKYSCLINDKFSKEATYIANMYNSATYEPIPCVKSIVGDSFIQMCHPIIKLRIFYIDMFMIEHKLGTVDITKYESLYMKKMIQAHDDIEVFDKDPSWIGYFIDEGYDKKRYNMKNRMMNPFETILI